jgi:hypothetical protein
MISSVSLSIWRYRRVLKAANSQAQRGLTPAAAALEPLKNSVWNDVPRPSTEARRMKHCVHVERRPRHVDHWFYDAPGRVRTNQLECTPDFMD